MEIIIIKESFFSLKSLKIQCPSNLKGYYKLTCREINNKTVDTFSPVSCQNR